MAIRLDRCVAGARFYSRGRHKMGNTTLSTLAEWPVTIIQSYDPEAGYAIASWNGNMPEQYHAHNLKRLYDWSMYNKNEAEVARGLCGAIVKVTRRKKCPKCKQRHASAQCPTKES